MISIIVRTTIMFFLVMFTMRIMGKKSLGEFQPGDLIAVMLISNLTSIVIEAPELPILYSVVPILLVMCYEVFITIAVKKSDKFAKFSQGETKVLIKNGIIDQQVMNRLRFTVTDILEAVRNKDIFYLEEVGLAVVSTTGSISVYPNPNANTEIDKATLPPVDVISDGKIQYEQLKLIDFSEDKVNKILKKEKTEMGDVLMLLVDGNGRYNLTVKEK